MKFVKLIEALRNHAARTSVRPLYIGSKKRARRPLRVESLEHRAVPAVSLVSEALPTSAAFGNGSSVAYPKSAVSADGRFVAFTSNATNLVANDTNNAADVFVRDLQTGAVTRASVASGGAQAAGGAGKPAMNTDGRFVAFTSNADNMVAGDTNGATDVFVHDRITLVTTRVSVASDGFQASGFAPAISADGRYVAFTSQSGNLVPGDTNGYTDVFVHDRLNGTTVRASVASDASQANYLSAAPAISADGRYVAFDSRASNLVAGDTNGLYDVFVRDLVAGTTRRVSVGPGGVQAAGGDWSGAAQISADGRIVAFHSEAINLFSGDTNGLRDVFVHTWDPSNPGIAGVTTLVSASSAGLPADGSSSDPAISPDVRFVVFQSAGTNVVPNDTNGVIDSFLRDLRLGTTTLVSRRDASLSPPASGIPSYTSGSDYNRGRQISNDGQYVTFTSVVRNLVPGDTNSRRDVFVRHLPTGAVSRVSVATGGAQANGDSYSPVLSADGRFVAFTSSASNLAAGDTNNQQDVFVHDLLTRTTTRVSVATGGAQGGDDSYSPTISADGRYVGFVSYGPFLVSGDTNGTQDVFVHDRQTAQTTRVSLATGGAQGEGNSSNPAISADGRYVAFESSASNLVAGDTNGKTDVFVHDRQTAQTTRVSVADNGAQGDGLSGGPSISADGRYVAFHSDSSFGYFGDTNGTVDVFVRDLNPGGTPTTRRASYANGGNVPASSSYRPSISADGRFVAFRSDADLLPSDKNGVSDVYVYDRVANSTERASKVWSEIGSDNEGGSDYPSISADGRFVVFQSYATNLLPGDANSDPDVFLHTRDALPPQWTNASTREDIQTSGLVIAPNPWEPFPITHFRINHYGGTLFLNDGVTPVQQYAYITVAQGAAGLKFTPFPNQNTSALNGFGVETKAAYDWTGTGLSPDRGQIRITVTAVNDAPSFTKGANQTVGEDAGAQSVTGWATAISKGPANEAGQTLTFELSNSNTGLFAVQPAIDAAGKLTYTPAAHANGSATVTVRLKDDGGTSDGGVDTSPDQTFTVSVNPVNDVPSFTKGANQTLNEDAAEQTVTGWATNLSAGPADESSQTLSFLVSNENTALFSVQPAIASNGTLTYAPASNAFGTATVTVRIQDNGTTANGGVDTSAAQTFTITLNPVNDVPSFTKGANQTVNEDAAGQTVNGWATAISKGPPNEIGQTLTFLMSNDNNALFSVQPAIDEAGTLTYTPAGNANGTATVTVSLQDNGGGADTSASQTFTLNVDPVNDTPSFTKGSDLTVDEDAGAQTEAAWATAISKGPPNEIGQTLTFLMSNDNNALFSVQPAITEDGTLTYTPAENANGSAIVTVSLQDNGGGADTSTAQAFTINVDSINDRPVLNPLATPMLPYTPVKGKILPAGSLISDLTESTSDIDTGALKGIAVTAVDNTKGIWQYNLTGAEADWKPIPTGADANAVSASHALLLADDGTTRVRFLPNARFTGFASITFKAWDQSNLQAEGTFDDTTDDLDLSYSTADDQAWVAVGKTKPAVDPDGRTILKPAKSDTKISAAVLVKDMIGIAGLETAKINLGVAIIDNNVAEGKWEFQLAKTKIWTEVGAVSSTSALLLKPTDKLRFTPIVNVDGDAELKFLTWDQTTGTAGLPKVNLMGMAGIGIEPGFAVLDLVPVLDLTHAAVLNPVDAGQISNEVTLGSLMSPNHIVGENVGVAIVAKKGAGIWQYKPVGGIWTDLVKVSMGKALFLNTADEVRFKADATAPAGTARLSFKAWDKTKVVAGSFGAASGTMVSKQTEILTVAIGNQPPTLLTPGVTMTSISNSKPNNGVLVKTLFGTSLSDPNGTKSLKGIAITGFTDNVGGKWQYSLGKNVWVDIVSVSKDDAILLKDTSKIRFLPNTGFVGSATISYKAWDQTAGHAGDRIDTDSGLNSFSLNTQTATINVTA